MGDRAFNAIIFVIAAGLFAGLFWGVYDIEKRSRVEAAKIYTVKLVGGETVRCAGHNVERCGLSLWNCEGGGRYPCQVNAQVLKVEDPK